MWVLVWDTNEITRKKEFGHVTPVTALCVRPHHPKRVHASLVLVLPPQYDLAYGRRPLRQDQEAPTRVMVRR